MITTFLVGPFATTLPLGEYFASAPTWAYLTNVSLVASYELPGVFEANPRPVVNGVLWTLGPEFICYLGVATAGLVGVALHVRRALVRAMAFAAVGLLLAVGSLLPLADFDAPRAALSAMAFFAIGAALAQFSGLRLSLWPCAIILPAWFLVGALPHTFSQVLAWATVPYLVLALGAQATPYIRRAGRFGDVSYGLYLWGFPIQQLIWQALPQLNLGVNLAAVLALTLVIAFTSWHLVEKRALSTVRARIRAVSEVRQPELSGLQDKP